MTRDDGVGARDGTASLLGDDVYWRLRQEIVRGELRPNQALAEADIAERLNVSRTPVRESMQRLAADGLVISRRRRWVVYEHSKQEIQEIYEVRVALEGYAARLASRRISDKQIAELTRLRSSIKTGSGLNARIEQNDTLHNSIVAIAGNERLLGLLAHNRNYGFNRQVASLYTPDDLSLSAEQHAKMLDAVIARNGSAAERIARAHIESALKIVIARLP
jgi:DNA-binding GntR family transcriptional regulator